MYDEIVTGPEIPGKKLTIIKHNDSGYTEGAVKVLSDVSEFHSDDPKAVIVNEVSAQADIVFDSGWLVSGTRLVSNKPSPNSGSSIDITITLRSVATISLNYGVSSEPNFDKLFLFLNSSLIDEISGIVEKSFIRSLSAGVYTIRLSYYKDVSIDKEEDLGWISNLRIVGSGVSSEVTVTNDVFLMPRSNISIKAKFSRDTQLPRNYREFPTILDMGKYVQPSKWPWSDLAITGGLS